MITIICAIGEDDSLGKDNQLLWHLPDDFRRFKQLTTGHSIIMGRKTFDSLPQALPNRKNIVITCDRNYHGQNCIVVSSLEEALSEARKHDDAPYIIGGAQIYELALPYADKLEITRVHATFGADVFFPKVDWNQWKLVSADFHSKDQKHAFDFTFETYIKHKI